MQEIINYPCMKVNSGQIYNSLKIYPLLNLDCYLPKNC